MNYIIIRDLEMFNSFKNFFSGKKQPANQQQQQQQQQGLNMQYQQNAYIPQQQYMSNMMPQQQMMYQGPSLSATPLDPDTLAWKDSEDPVVALPHDKQEEHIAKEIPPLAECLVITPTLDSNYIVHDSAGQRKGLMITINETKMGQSDKDTTKVDIVCIIDNSGSMSGSKLDNVKTTLKSLLEILKGSRIALVLFDSNASMLMNFKTVNDDNVPRITKVIESIQALNSTNITAGVHVSQNLLGSRATKNNAASMFLLSDGQHNQGPINNDILFKDDFARTNAEYTLHTFGYGDDHDAKLMQSMAERKAGNYYFVNDIKRVDECFFDCLGMVTTSLATKGRLTLKLLPTSFYPEIRVVRTFGSYLTKKSDNEVEIAIENIYAGIKKNYLLEVEFDGAKKLVEAPVVATIGELNFLCSELGKAAQTTLHSTFTVQIEPKTTAVLLVQNLEVKKNYFRVKGGELMKEADEKRNSGQGKEAIIMLEDFKKDLQKVTELAQDPLTTTLISQINHIIKMINNDLSGIANECLTKNYMMQQANYFANEQSAPLYESKAMFSNAQQSRNMKALSKMKK